MALGAWSVPANAHWERVAEEGATISYADPQTIVRNADVVRMMSLIDYRNFQRMVEVGYFSQRTVGEYDCAGRRHRTLAVALHADRMGEGKVIYSDESAHDWMPVAAGTSAEALWKIACR